MTRAEITAYMYGTALVHECLSLAAEGRGAEMPTCCFLDGEQQAALEQLGAARFGQWIVRGGRDVLAEHGAV